MGLTVCRGSDIGKMPVNARIGCGFFPAVALYVATTVWYCYGCKIYLTLGMPTFEKENISTNAAEINIEVFKAIHKESGAKAMWTYVFMLGTTTFSFFHITMAINLLVTILAYIGLIFSGMHHQAQNMTMRPDMLWKFIDLGFFSLLTDQSEEDYQRDTESDIEKRIACGKLQEREFS